MMAKLTGLCDHKEVGHILHGRGIADFHGCGRAVALHAVKAPVGGLADDRDCPHWAYQGVALHGSSAQAGWSGAESSRQ